MKSDELMVLALAGVAVFLIVKSGGIAAAKASPLPKQNTYGLIYTPDPFYSDTSKYDAYAPIAKANGGWGIE